MHDATMLVPITAAIIWTSSPFRVCEWGYTALLDAEDLVSRLNRALGGWANYFNLGPVTKTYRFVDAYTNQRLRRWLCNKHKHPGTGLTRYPDEYLYKTLGLIRLPLLPQRLPWAKA
jgi:RNA-directed DNA polymerase